MDTVPVQHRLDETKRDVEENKDIAAVSYIPPLSFVVFVLRRDSHFCTFHSKQAMTLFALGILAWLVPFAGKLLDLVVLIAMAYGFLEAAQGQATDIPIVGPLSRGDLRGTRTSWKSLLDSIVKTWRRLLRR